MSVVKQRSSVVSRVLLVLVTLLLQIVVVFAARRNNNVFGAGGVFKIIQNFAEGLFRLLGEHAFFSILIIVLLFILFRYLLLLGIAFLPDSVTSKIGNGSGSDSSKAIKNLSTILALLITFGLVGFLSYNEYNFSLENVYTRVSIILLTLGTIGVWAFAGLFGALAYYVSVSYAKKKAENNGEITFKERIGILLVTVGLTLFVANGMMDRNIYTGIILGIIGLILLTWGYVSMHSAEASKYKPVKRPSTLSSPDPNSNAIIDARLRDLYTFIFQMGDVLERIHALCDSLLTKVVMSSGDMRGRVLNNPDLKQELESFKSQHRIIIGKMIEIQHDHFSELTKEQKRNFREYKKRVLQYEIKVSKLLAEFREKVIAKKQPMKPLWS